ncbi:MAG: hypothetical protein Q7R87_04910 [Nanoarchaeota archaeon]|nr:hypothetical protein [Nanoarchaeota archaeon]
MKEDIWLKSVKLNCSKNILDVVQFGSSVIEGKEFRDIDIAVIFNKISVKEQLNEAQDIKNQLRKFTDKDIHITSLDLYSLFEDSNFARDGVLFYGVSLLDGKKFAEKFGLKPFVQIQYSLKKFSKKDKIKFNYLLSGRGGKYGLLREYGGYLIAPGIININPEHEKVFLEEIKKINVDIDVKKIFIINN